MIRRIANFLRPQGRRIIGWEEILDGNADKDCVVQWWRLGGFGTAGAVNAARKGHQVIASPNQRCYLSFPVTPDKFFGPARTSDLRKVYEAEYVPAELSPAERELIIGAEVCIWTERLNESQIDRMLFPRALAAAELMWRYPKERDIKEFAARVRAQEPYWSDQGVEYGPAFAEAGEEG